MWTINLANPDSKVHGANVGPIWGRQDPGGPHVGPKNFAIWEQTEAGDTSWLTIVGVGGSCYWSSTGKFFW